MHKRLSRQQFLRLMAAAAVAPFVAGCARAAEPPAPAPTWPAAPSATLPPAPSPTAAAAARPPTASAPAPSPTPPPATATRPAPTQAPASGSPSRVVQAHLPGVWAGDQLAPAGLARLLDHAITRLTGLNGAGEAWLSLFKPGERIAIKVNTIAGSRFWTHPALVEALTARLAAAGIPPENILVFDRQDSELRAAGYTLNRDGPGARCAGSNGRYAGPVTVAGAKMQVSELLLGVDALINLPLLKQHGMAGFSFALKNHYGSIDSPGSLHSGERLTRGMAELNALEAIRAKTRLVIGDALEACLFNWNSAKRGDSLLMSFDPVAHDTIGLQHYASLLEAEGGSPAFARQRAGSYLAEAAQLGLGVNDPQNIELIEETL